MTMSEALASMNGNLAGQQDEIEELKLQLKVTKNGSCDLLAANFFLLLFAA